MHKHLAALLLCLLACLGATGATFTVTGTVTDTAGVAEPFATLRVMAMADSANPGAQPLLGVAKDDGTFRVELPKAASYRLAATAVGKAPGVRDFTVTASQPVARLGRVELQPANELEEVEVTAVKPIVSREIDRIAYDVQADPDSKTDMLTEILKKVPLVTVEPDGTVKVRGDTGFKVYKNGRPNNTYSKNAKEIFKAIPASSIEKIEVITDPGAREDAEGAGVILNIVTTRNISFKGVTGNVGFQAYTKNQMVPQPNAYITTQIDKVTMSLTGSMTHATVHGSGPNYIHGERVYAGTGNVQAYTQTNNNTSNSYYGGLELSWEPDTLNLFTVEAGTWDFAGRWWGTGTNETRGPGDELLYAYTTEGSIRPNHSVNVWGAANYQRTTRLKNEAITFSYRIDQSSSHTVSQNRYVDAVNMPVPYDKTIDDSRPSFWEHTFQLDWQRPLSQTVALDLGSKYIMRRQRSKSLNQYVPAWSDTTDFSHNFDILGVYADLRAQVGRVGMRAGLRYEYSRLNARFHDGSDPDFGRSLNDWVPNAAVQWNATDNYSLRLGYSTSISRPNISVLNPTVKETPQSVSSGNPHLTSQFYQDLTLTQDYFTNKASFELTASYAFCNNTINTVQWTEGDVTHSTFRNNGRHRSLYFGIWSQFQLGSKTTLSVNAGTNRLYRNLGPGMDEYTHWNVNGSFNVTQRLPWGLRASLFVSASNSYRDFYMSVSNKYDLSWLRYTLSLRRSFLDQDRLSVGLGITNPFKHNYNTSRAVFLEAGGFTGGQWQKDRYSTYATVSVSYRFGSLKAQVKKTAGSITNNDLQKN